MVNLNLTESELVFLQRLIGHNFVWNSVPDGLYNKIADKTDKLGITSHTPLNLEDVSKYSWHFTQGGKIELLLKLGE